MATAEADARPGWLDWPVCRALVDGLGEAHLCFVGGAVRDHLLGLTIEDVDAATDLTPDRVMAALDGGDAKVIPTGLDHGTVTVALGGRAVEVTTLRRDVKSHGRRADVAFTRDWEADARRRDFTMNALYMCPDGRLYDPLDGASDLAAGRVRFIGDPMDRIQEDALRLLRYYRFLARFPAGAVCADSRRAAAAHPALLDGLSRERIGAETRKLLAAPDPSRAVAFMAEDGLWPHVLGDGASHLDFAGFDRLMAADRMAGGAGPGPALARLAVLAGGAAAPVVALKRALRLSNREERGLAACVAALAADEALDGPDAPGVTGAMRRLLYRFGRDAANLAVRMQLGGAGGLAAMLHRLNGLDTPVLPVTARDLMARGVPRGPTLGDRLADLERHWLDAGCRPDRAALLSLVDQESGSGAVSR
ncbi:CCA tRNA nucleotidyltransferase [Yunchengibacter salinarum]|uniref:CCA tRNA nucleotidyltransferase n=1 Tax=Yunchengibacter salinarum TaxID=3133399 RepID=UPI0035B66B9D